MKAIPGYGFWESFQWSELVPLILKKHSVDSISTRRFQRSHVKEGSSDLIFHNICCEYVMIITSQYRESVTRGKGTTSPCVVSVQFLEEGNGFFLSMYTFRLPQYWVINESVSTHRQLHFSYQKCFIVSQISTTIVTCKLQLAIFFFSDIKRLYQLPKANYCHLRMEYIYLHIFSLFERLRIMLVDIQYQQ